MSLPRTHPRLYLTPGDLPALRAARGDGLRARIWANLEASAHWCLTRPLRRSWIAPVTPDPRHENLYDRFYAIMGDLAVTEHLAFAYALGDDPAYGAAARAWALASCRVWRREADGAVDGGKAYAVTRLLKGVAVAYDLVHDLLADDERREVRDSLAAICRRYFADYFTTPAVAGGAFHTHHATVEYASFGVAALALLDEVPEAQAWLDVTVRKFAADLLPRGLAADGAQTEGTTFWASTLHYRLFFMDALRRVTGTDLFAPWADRMHDGPALAGIATTQGGEYATDDQAFVLQPSYGQLDYAAPALLGLARFYRRPACQALAGWDERLGHLQRTRYVTPQGEQLLFALGGYAYVWYDPTVPASTAGAPLSWRFPSVDEAYLRASWQPGDLLAGVRHGTLVAHAGGDPVLVGSLTEPAPVATAAIASLTDDGDTAALTWAGGDAGARLVLQRGAGRLTVHRTGAGPWSWHYRGRATQHGESLAWLRGGVLRLRAGHLMRHEPDACPDELVVGNGLLRLVDAAPATVSRVTVEPDAHGQIVVDISAPPR